MPTPVAVLSGGTRGFELGMFKKGPIAQGFNFPLNTNYTWWNGVDILSTQYLIYTDKYTMGSSTLANTIPVAWSTPNLNDSSLLALINTLPPRVGLPGFTDLDAALNWMDGTGDFFLLKNGIENIVTTNLELYYDAGLYTSYAGTGVSVSDLSGNNRTGTLTNGITFLSSGVASFELDGTDDYITSSLATNANNNVTLEAWFNSDNVNQDGQMIIYNGSDSSGNGYGFSINQENVTTGNVYALYGALSWFNTGFTLKSGVWYHGVMTIAGTSLKLYINGSLIYSVSSSNPNTPSLYTNIGRNDFPAARYFNGKIPIARVYTVALSADQVLQNYNAQKDRFGITAPVQTDLIVELDAAVPASYGGSGTQWSDISGYNNNGVLTNGPTFSTGNGGYINFDGSDDYVKITNGMNSLVGTNQVTFAAWIYRDSAPNYWAGIISNKVNGTDGISLLVNPSSKIFWQYDSTSGVYAIDQGETLSTGVWYYIAGVYDSVGLKTFLNGALNQAANDSGKSININGNMDIHVAAQEYLSNPASYFPGRVSRVEIYKRGLSAPEMVQNFYAVADRYGLGIVKSGLVFNVDGGNFASYIGSGTTWNDIGGGMYDVKLLNGPTYTTSGGGALIFDATDDYGQMNPSVIPVGTQISICFWNYGISLIASSIIASSYNSSDQTLNIHLPWSNANVYWDCGFPFNRIQKFASNEEYQGWHHWVFTKNATTGVMNIYLDGSLWHTGSGLTSSIPAMDIASLGNYFTGTLPHNGYIGQCQIYRKELNSTEITQNFTADRLRYGV